MTRTKETGKQVPKVVHPSAFHKMVTAKTGLEPDRTYIVTPEPNGSGRWVVRTSKCDNGTVGFCITEEADE